jgi:hypothetical protein
MFLTNVVPTVLIFLTDLLVLYFSKKDVANKVSLDPTAVQVLKYPYRCLFCTEKFLLTAHFVLNCFWNIRPD